MNRSILRFIATEEPVREAVHSLLRSVPADGPALFHADYIGSGEIQFTWKAGQDRMETVTEAFGADGWQREARRFDAGFDLVKTHANGVVIRLENFAPSDAEPVRPAYRHSDS